jgi:hypothetical protein
MGTADAGRANATIDRITVAIIRVRFTAFPLSFA